MSCHVSTVWIPGHHGIPANNDSDDKLANHDESDACRMGHLRTVGVGLATLRVKEEIVFLARGLHH